MNDFKLEFYFHKYKDKPFVNRRTFRNRFIRENGKYEKLEELIKKVENYQVKKYGITLYFDNHLKRPTKEEVRKISNRVLHQIAYDKDRRNKR